MDLSGRTIAVIGLGYVGLPLAVEFGKNRSVVGYDTKASRLAELSEGRDCTLEVTKDALAAAKHLVFTDKVEDLRKAQIYIVTVPTPVDKANRPNLSQLIKASEIVGKVLKADDIVIYESTVYPGCTEEVCIPILERESGLRFNSDFYAGYSPERISPGDKSRRLPDIKKVTSGSTQVAARAIDSIYKEIIIAGTHLASSIKVAEAAKVIENAQRDLNIAFVNELSVIFNRMGIDTSEVLQAASTKWNFLPFTPGLVGGHCIGVDPYYLTHKAQELGYQPEVILSGRRINDNMAQYAARNLIRLMIKSGISLANANVGILGVTFKENCVDVRNSKVISIIQELESWGVNVKVMDPWANPQEVHEEYGLTLSQITPQAPVDSLLVAVAHTQFAQLTPQQLRGLCANHAKPVIADLKALYDRVGLEGQGFEVFRF